VSISFLDVGQGDGTLISASTTGELILIDLGSKKNGEIAGADAIKAVTNAIIASMQFRGSDIPVLNKLLLTHGDADHYNLVTQLSGYVRILTGKDLKIMEVAIGGRKADYDKELQDAVLTPADEAGVLTTFANSYHDKISKDGKTITPKWTFALGAAKLYLLSANFPYRDTGAKNPKSLVTMVDYAAPKQRVILTGDAEDITEESILKYYKKNLKFLESFGLKLGHHGSQKGSSLKWIKTVKPLANFASSDMKWAHPYCETIARIVETIGPGAVLYNHKWLCGRGGGEQKEYQNFTSTDGFYTTMASMTDVKTKDPEEGVFYPPGLVQGVQYQLNLYDDGTMQLTDTLGGDSGVFNPARSLLGEPVERVADSIEMEGFRVPFEVRRDTWTMMPKQRGKQGCCS
jgi:hypothetical protein